MSPMGKHRDTSTSSYQRLNMHQYANTGVFKHVIIRAHACAGLHLLSELGDLLVVGLFRLEFLTREVLLVPLAALPELLDLNPVLLYGVFQLRSMFLILLSLFLITPPAAQ